MQDTVIRVTKQFRDHTDPREVLPDHLGEAMALPWSPDLIADMRHEVDHRQTDTMRLAALVTGERRQGKIAQGLPPVLCHLPPTQHGTTRFRCFPLRNHAAGPAQLQQELKLEWQGWISIAQCRL